MSDFEMWGQWQGQLSTSGQTWDVLLNIDRDRPTEARLLLCDGQQHTKWRHAKVTNLVVENLTLHATTEFSPYPFNLPADEDQKSEPKDTLHGTMSGDLLENKLNATLASTGAMQGVSGAMKLCRIDVEANAPSEPHYCFTWPEFVTWVSNIQSPYGQLIFRGHKKATYRLTTTLHRTGRRDLIRYREEDLTLLRVHVSGVNGKPYRLNDLDDYHNLLSLAQHHGYPTPLLDWTESPYLAAYFALRGVPRVDQDNDSNRCRILAFDADTYQQEAGGQYGALEVPFLSLHCARAGCRDNDRAMPQQSIFMLSTVVDIERYIENVENELHKRIMTRIDLTMPESRAALSALRSMGITEASLFPGLDGICKELRDRFFG